ncbi:MAG: beta-eliminating lyase-related protein [Oscillospiraceae bacterium]|nr:beta-eliminating lyase-related protein [Oscillospiraceae bacterium]
MISFANDYAQGAHPKVLQRLAETNLEPLAGYGEDKYCESTKSKIRALCGCPDAEVELLVGGTQTNAVVISSMLRSCEGVVAAETGHVSSHEAGAIEFTGHKVLTLPQREGKLAADTLKKYLSEFYADENHEHMVFPGMVYISHPTEYGTLYSRGELRDLARVCRTYNMPLYLDGARLGYGLMSRGTDVTLRDIAECCDVFYIGGTKVGALCGEAVVFAGGSKPKHFMTIVKQRGALLAKGRLLGVQFDALFTDGLYFELSRHAIDMAERLKELFRSRGVEFFIESPTNQQFVVLENSKLDALRQRVAVSVWQKLNGTHTVVRFATSWATTAEDIAALAELL